MNFSLKTKQELEKYVSKRPKSILTIGTISGDTQQIITLDSASKPMEGRNLRYDIGSLTKTFTVALMAKHAYEGTLSFDDSLDKHIEGLPEGYYPTLRRLATHAAGYPAPIPFGKLFLAKSLLGMNKPNGLMRVNPYRGALDEKVMFDILKSTKLQDKDYKFSYSNFSFGILGYIAGQKASTNYWEAMDRFVQEEFGMKNTWIASEDSLIGYDQKSKECRNWQWDKSDVIIAAGAITSDAQDVLKYLKSNMYDEKPYLKMCHKKYGEGNKKWQMGLGWRIKPNTQIFWHDGNAGCFSAFAAFDKEKKVGTVLMCNYGLVNMQNLGFAVLEDINQQGL